MAVKPEFDILYINFHKIYLCFAFENFRFYLFTENAHRKENVSKQQNGNDTLKTINISGKIDT